MVSGRKEESQNSERCKRERAETDDDDDAAAAAVDDDDDDVNEDDCGCDETRLGSASSCMSSCIMLKDCASCASSANVSFIAFQQPNEK